MKKLAVYKEMHRTICIKNMQRVKWIDQYLYNYMGKKMHE